MSFYKFRGEVPVVVVPRAAFHARQLRAYERRASIARTRAERNPSPENLLDVTELDAGLQRLRGDSLAVAA